MHLTRDIHSYHGTADRGEPMMSGIALLRVLCSVGLVSVGLFSASLVPASLVLAPLSPALAQPAPSAQQATALSPDAIKQREQELEAAREEQRKAAELQKKLK